MAGFLPFQKKIFTLFCLVFPPPIHDYPSSFYYSFSKGNVKNPNSTTSTKRNWRETNPHTNIASQFKTPAIIYLKKKTIWSPLQQLTIFYPTKIPHLYHPTWPDFGICHDVFRHLIRRNEMGNLWIRWPNTLVFAV